MTSTSGNPSPLLRANICSKMFYHWLSSLLRKSRQQGTLCLDDLYDLPSGSKSNELTDKFEMNWLDELKRNPNNPSLIRTTLRTLGWKLFFVAFFALIHGIAMISQSILITFLMEFFEPCSSMSMWHAWGFAITTILAPLIASISIHWYYYKMRTYGRECAMAYCGLIYRKLLRLSTNALNSISSGEITNLIANDVNKALSVFDFLNYFWISPVLAILVIAVFWHFVRYIAFVAIAYAVFLLIVQPLYIRIFVHICMKTLHITDERLKKMSEIIKSMRIIKVYCWETAFSKEIVNLRKREIVQYTYYAIAESVQMLFSNSFSSVSFLFMYGAMWSLNIRFDTSFFAMASCILAFTKIFVIDFVMYGTQEFSNYTAAEKRIESFLLLDECERDNRLLSTSNLELSSAESTKLLDSTIEKDVEVICDLKKAQWTKNESFTLKNIVFNARPGDLICIIGPVGSGKSSLLQALTGEIGWFDGKVRLRGSYCYVPQEAWIFSSTLKNNILFGKEYDPNLFQSVVEATALDIDFEQLSDGVNTTVGDRGVMLSGGQKARVNMARALYRDADIYLLDDPLSAVDVKVCKHLFEKAIKDYLKNKVCILVTHQIQFLKDATKIVFLKNGEMIHMGSYDEILRSSSSLADLLENIHQREPDSANDDDQQFVKEKSTKAELTPENEDILFSNIDAKQEGSIQWDVYKSYMKAGLGSSFGCLLVLVSLIVNQVVLLYSGWWLATWSDDESYRYGNFTNCTSATTDNMNHINEMNKDQWEIYRSRKFLIYCGLILALLFITFFRILLSKLMCLNAGRALHNKMFKRVVHCPISFFDTNSVGRILNRFSRDVTIMDINLTSDIPDFLESVATVLGVVVLVGIINPWSFIPALLALIGMIINCFRFIRCFRDLKRIEGATRSPIYSYLSSTIHGLKVIRSYYAEKMCSNEFLAHVDDNGKAILLLEATEKWAAMRFECVSLAFLTLVTFLSVVLRIYQHKLSTADIALILSYSINLIGLLQWAVRQSVKIETQMTAVERVTEYCSLDQEPPRQVQSGHQPPNDWPSQGQIVFRNVSMSHSNDPESPLALHNLTLTIEGTEKVGIVGRTGAGKSSFLQTLFRMGTLANGRIEIDNIDIASIGLDDLRSRISVIPQDPILFTGTIRQNLDPFNNYTDEDVWKALEQVQLKTLVSDIMSDGLDSSVSENGSNLSIGQKQLLCLARAILKKSKILVIDEATANVDNVTDELIQEVIRNKFQECTILTIAHRLRTVIDNDRIMVLGNGELIEFDAPSVLLSNPNSHLSALVEQTGPAEAEYLRTMVTRSKPTQKPAQQNSMVDQESSPDGHETDPLLTHVGS